MMIKKSKFSLHAAYSWGFKVVVEHFGMFLLTMGIGFFAGALFLAAIGSIDFWAFREHFGAISKLVAKVMSEPAGIAHYGNHTFMHYLQQHLPHAVSSEMLQKSEIAIDFFERNAAELLGALGISILVFKLFIDLITIGWIKMALDLQDNKQDISEGYLFKFYNYVPAYFVVNLLAGIVVLAVLGVVGGIAYGAFRDGHHGVAVVVGLLSMIPGIYVHQRLRFSKYFVLDKGMGIIDAMRASWNMTCGSVLHLVFYSIFAAFVAGLGSVIFLLLFFVTPLAFQADAHVYRQMVKSK